MQEWKKAWWFIEPAVQMAGEMEEADVVEKIATCKYHLFMVYGGDQAIGALTLHVGKSGRRTIATIVHLGGDLDRMIPCFEDLKAWTRALGATVLRFWGRKGWRRRAAEYGFEEKFVVMEASI